MELNLDVVLDFVNRNKKEIIYFWIYFMICVFIRKLEKLNLSVDLSQGISFWWRMEEASGFRNIKLAFRSLVARRLKSQKLSTITVW